ncbi:hypothetical protein E2C01_015470 [Portunus trituberculatus]|uniref:Uncharacterized protein n=1 Tax=Portunus trituberculatus TaxID=210409 RepID=A0A5B7DMN8_PORTR|nr:hypothetical protein [Portunus trituberculatus]
MLRVCAAGCWCDEGCVALVLTRLATELSGGVGLHLRGLTLSRVVEPWSRGLFCASEGTNTTKASLNLPFFPPPGAVLHCVSPSPHQLADVTRVESQAPPRSSSTSQTLGATPRHTRSYVMFYGEACKAGRKLRVLDT